jgi:hypothetical protein
MCPEDEIKNRKKVKLAAMQRESKPVSLPKSPETDRVDASNHTQATDLDSQDETTIDPLVGAADEESKDAVCCPCAPPGLELPGTDEKADAITSALYSLLVASLPEDRAVKIERSFSEESRKILFYVDGEDGTRTGCYELMQVVKATLLDSVARSGVLTLLSARVEREEYGYSLRSSVACIFDDKRDQMCFDVLRKGSCSKRMCCPWYHPQPCDIVRFKVAMRCYPKKIPSEQK